MSTSSNNSVLTTGEVARICHVAPRTVSKWFDQGKLHGFRIPGSRDRRIPRQQLLEFMRAYGLPMDAIDGGMYRVLLVSPSDLAGATDALVGTGRYEVRQAANGFAAGLQAQQLRPHAVVLDAAIGLEEAVALCGNIRTGSAVRGTKVLAASADADHTAEWFVRMGFDGFLRMPLEPDELDEMVARATCLAA